MITKYYEWASLQRVPPGGNSEISKEQATQKELDGEVYYIGRLDDYGTLLYLEKRSHREREFLYKYTYIQGKIIKRRVSKIERKHH